MHNPFRSALTVTGYWLKATQRRAADEWLQSATGTFVPEQYSWRAQQLCSKRNRSILAGTLRRIEESAFDPNSRWRIANVAAVRANRQPLRNLARRLEDANQAVTPAGMLRATHLITDGSSPLYNPAKTQQLERFIESTIELLEPRTATRAA
jgi:hypothetical protein